MLIPILYILAAIIVLYFGADMTLEAAEKFGKKLGLSPLVIGMLLVGFGTSLPEFFVGHIASSKGETGIAMGSLLGSNIANMFLILGVCGLFSRLSVQGKSLREHLFIHLGLGVILIWVLNQPSLNLLTSSPLLALLFIYLFFIYKDMQREKIKKEDMVLKIDPDAPIVKSNTPLLFLKMNIGFLMLYIGGELLVKGGSELGIQAGIDAYTISSIFIAFGTSFPELVTALMAALKKKDTDIIIGNIVGSNLFNCAFILGSLGIYDFKIDQSFTYELTALVAGALVFILLSFIKRDLYRFTSFLFLATYGIMVGHWLKLI
jgi:cation:H+ antiporter